MTRERAFEIATKVCEYIDEYENGGYGEKWLFTIETANLAEALQKACTYKTIEPLKPWYNKLKEMLEDEMPEEEIEEMMMALDEWEGVA